MHFALHIDENAFDQAVERVRRAGHDAAVHAFDEDNAGRAAYVTDPDGNVVELWTWDVRGHLQ